MQGRASLGIPAPFQNQSHKSTYAMSPLLIVDTVPLRGCQLAPCSNQPSSYWLWFMTFRPTQLMGRLFRQGHHIALERIRSPSLKKIKWLTENSICGREREKENLKRTKSYIFYHLCKLTSLEVARDHISLANQDNCGFDKPTSTWNRPPETTWWIKQGEPNQIESYCQI